MERLLLSYYSIGSLAPLIMLSIMALFLFLKRAKTPASWWLAFTFVGFDAMLLGYFVAHSWFAPEAAFHRLLTVCVLFGQAALATFGYAYPRPDRPSEARIVIPAAWLIAAFGWTEFAWATRHLEPRYDFEAHLYSFHHGRVASVLILSNLVWWLVLFGRKTIRYSIACAHETKLNETAASQPDPSALRRLKAAVGYLLRPQGADAVACRGFFIAGVLMLGVGVANGLNKAGRISYETYSATLSVLVILTVFTMLLAYINNSPEPTTFMVKLVGISLFTVLLVLGYVSNYTLSVHERYYDQQRISDVVNSRGAILAGRFAALPPAVEYVLRRPDRPGMFNSSEATILFTRPGSLTLDRLHTGEAAQRQAWTEVEMERIRGQSSGASPHEMAIRVNRKMRETVLPALASETLSAGGIQRQYRNAQKFFTHYDFLSDHKRYEVGFSYHHYRVEVHQIATGFVYIMGGCGLLILLVFPLFFRASLVSPLARLLSGVSRVDQGDLGVDVPIQSADEIGRLTASFNKMVGTIRDARDDLERRVNERTSELSAALQRLTEMDELKTNFFANISHELRTPLTLILSPVESLLQGDLGHLTADQNTHLSTVHKNAQKLLKLINNLLDFAKLEAGRMDLSYHECDFVVYVRELVSAFDSAARGAGLELSVTAPRARIAAFIDPDRMEKIVLNLLSNALKFTHAGGVYLHVAEVLADDDAGNPAQDWVELTVRDTGIGIPPDRLESVFERFRQVDGSASRRYEGTGIGLSLARELAALHGGTLVAESDGRSGSTFRLRFPRAPEGLYVKGAVPEIQFSAAAKKSSTKGGMLAELADRLTDSMKSAATVTPTSVQKTIRLVSAQGESVDLMLEPQGGQHKSRETVLIVEDTHDMRKFLYFLIRPMYTVLTARNGLQGLRMAETHRPDLIVSDVMMPEMNGYELVAAIRRHPDLKTTPVILLTAKADVTMKIEGLELGADDYVVKPFNSKELLSRMRSQLRMAALQRDVVSMRDRLTELNEKLTTQVQTQVSQIVRSDRMRTYLPQELIDEILSGKEPTVFSERRKLTIFFSDIVDFTRTTEDTDPEELATLLNQYMSEMTEIATKHGGTVSKFIGDGLLIYFGQREDDAEQSAKACVRMAVDMQARMRSLAPSWLEQGFSTPFQIRCGINTGYAAIGNFGSAQRLDYTVIGSNVNLAARIQAHAPPGGILVSHSTWAMVRNEFDLATSGTLSAKGFHKQVLVYAVNLDA